VARFLLSSIARSVSVLFFCCRIPSLVLLITETLQGISYTTVATLIKFSYVALVRSLFLSLISFSPSKPTLLLEGKWAYEITMMSMCVCMRLCVCPSPFQILNKLNTFHETQCEIYAAINHCSFVILNILQSVIIIR
jgi:hypothetical protein